ncbi:MAG: PqqD family protein [Theionarchaea archaeon]|nr:PqqD family protein [Theionarchaea archaeon]
MIPEKRDDVICREEEFGAIIFDPSAGRMHKLNTEGHDIWNLCDGKTDVDTIAKKMAEKEGEDVEEAKSAVEAFLKDMEERNLIRWH